MNTALWIALAVGATTFLTGLLMISSDAIKRLLRHKRLVRRLELFAAFLMVGAALAGALALHQSRLIREQRWRPKIEDTCDMATRFGVSSGATKGHPKCYYYSVSWHRKAGWQDPVALLILFAGVGGGVVLSASALQWPRDHQRAQSDL